MKKLDVKTILESMGVDIRTISIDTESDLEYGTCDISGEETMVYDVTALDTEGDEISFQASEVLVGGALGAIAGYF